jgi:phenylpyruvate tautomerase PptA (4-oxalocrotonate tautomerase family)
VQAIHEVGGLDKDLVWLTYEDIPPSEWYVGDKKVEQIWAEKEKK